MLRSELGLSVTRSFLMGKSGCFAPKVWLSGINECEMVKCEYKSSFADQTIPFEVRTFNKPIYLVSPGAELSFSRGNGLSFSLRYAAELNRDIATQKLDGRVEWSF